MNTSRFNGSIALAAAAGLAAACSGGAEAPTEAADAGADGAETVAAADEGAKEKCYGISLAGQNDCAAGEGICRFVDYQWCDTEGTKKCTAPSSVGENAPCSMNTGEKCSGTLRCDKPFEPGGRCFASLAEGAPCSDQNNRCGFGLECINDRCSYDAYTGMCPATN